MFFNSLTTVARFRKTACCVLAFVALTAALLLLASTFFGGVRVHSPWGVLSATRPFRLVVIALVCAALFEWIKVNPTNGLTGQDPNRLHVSKAAHPAHGFPAIGVATVMGFAALWLSFYFIYRNQNPALIPLTLMLYLASAIGAYRLYRFHAVNRKGFCALPGCGFWFVSPMVMPVSWPVVMVYTLLAVIALFCLSPHRSAKMNGSWSWTIAAILSLVFFMWLVSTDYGWGIHRVRNQLHSLTFGGVWLVPGTIGFVSLVFLRPVQRGHCFFSLAVLALPAMTLMGARGIPGFAGTALMVPLLSLLFVECVCFFREWTLKRNHVFFLNIVLICFLAYASAWMRKGPRLGVRVSVVGKSTPVLVRANSDHGILLPIDMRIAIKLV